MLGAAFRAPNVKKAAELADQVEREGAAAWKLDTTLADLKLAVEQAEGQDIQNSLRAICERLERVKE